MNNVKKHLKGLVSRRMEKGGSLPIDTNTDSIVDFRNNYLKDYLSRNTFEAIADEELDGFMSGLSELANAYNYAKGGIHINPANKGKFTAQAESHGMGVQEFANRVMSNKDDYSPATVKRANFARNAKKFKHAEGGEIDEAFIQWYSQMTPEGQQGVEYSEELPYDYFSYFQNHVLSGEVEGVEPELIAQYQTDVNSGEEEVDMSMTEAESAPMMQDGGPYNVSGFVDKYKELLARGEGDRERIGNTFSTAMHKLKNPVYTIDNAQTTFNDANTQALWEEYQRDLASATKPTFQDKGEVNNKTVPSGDDAEFERFKAFFERLNKENSSAQNAAASYMPVTRQVYSGSYAPANWSWLTGRPQNQGQWFNILPYNVENTTAKQMVEERNWLGRPKRITTTFEHRGNDNGFSEWLKTRNAAPKTQESPMFQKANTNIVPVGNFPNSTPIAPNKGFEVNPNPQLPVAQFGMDNSRNPFGINGVLQNVDYNKILETNAPLSDDPFAETRVDYRAHNPFDVSNYADWGLAAMSGISNIGESIEMNRLQRQIAERMTGDALTPSVGAGDVSRGTWTTNQGYFRPNQHVPVQFSGFNAGRIGGSGQYQEGGEYEMTDAEIAEFIKRGGKLEYL